MTIDLILVWRRRAQESREEAQRILKTRHNLSEAVHRCELRAEMWETCADELEKEMELLLRLADDTLGEDQ